MPIEPASCGSSESLTGSDEDVVSDASGVNDRVTMGDGTGTPFAFRFGVRPSWVLSEVSGGGHARIGAAFNTDVPLVVLEPMWREVIPDRAWVTLTAGSDYQ